MGVDLGHADAIVLFAGLCLYIIANCVNEVQLWIWRRRYRNKPTPRSRNDTGIYQYKEWMPPDSH